MSIKEIWLAFYSSLKEHLLKSWLGIKQVCSSTFE